MSNGASAFGQPGQSGGISVLDDIYSQNVFFSEINAVWPDLWKQQALVAPARNGMNRFTGALLQGWEHVEQSMAYIFMTPYHTRPLRRWVGSFVPRLLGESIIPRVITRYWWAKAEALELWEPNYRIKQIYFMGSALDKFSPPQSGDAADLIRLGQITFRDEGIYRPRAHLGDFTVEDTRYVAAIGFGSGLWDIVPISVPP